MTSKEPLSPDSTKVLAIAKILIADNEIPSLRQFDDVVRHAIIHFPAELANEELIAQTLAMDRFNDALNPKRPEVS